MFDDCIDEQRKIRDAAKTWVAVAGERRGWVRAYFRGNFSYSVKHVCGEIALCETPLFKEIRQAVCGIEGLAYPVIELPDGFSERRLLEWGNRRGLLNASGLERWRSLTAADVSPVEPDTADVKPDAADVGRYRKLSDAALRLRQMLYDERETLIGKAKRKRGEKGQYSVEPWKTWIPKFTRKRAVQKLLHESFNLKTGKGYTRVAASELDSKGWKSIYEQERVQRGKSSR